MRSTTPITKLGRHLIDFACQTGVYHNAQGLGGAPRTVPLFVRVPGSGRAHCNPTFINTSATLAALAMMTNDNDPYKQLCRIVPCLSDTDTITYSTMLQNTVQRSHHGCTRCKKRRQKCDELRPCCSRCMEAGSQCSYTKALKWLVAPRQVGRKKKELSTGEKSCSEIKKMWAYLQVLANNFPLTRQLKNHTINRPINQPRNNEDGAVVILF